MGNLRSVQKAFESLGVSALVTADHRQIAEASHLVLPGVGAFRDAIQELRRQELVEPIRAHLAQDRPFLGICLGLQLLFDVSHEDGQWDGLGVIAGTVERFPDQPGFKVPHMGWNQLLVQKEDSPLLRGISRDAYFYFVHSYHVVPRDPGVITARSDYILPFTAMIERGNLFATQFHPEKSQQVGLKLLQNFSTL